MPDLGRRRRRAAVHDGGRRCPTARRPPCPPWSAPSRTATGWCPDARWPIRDRRTRPRPDAAAFADAARAGLRGAGRRARLTGQLSTPADGGPGVVHRSGRGPQIRPARPAAPARRRVDGMDARTAPPDRRPPSPYRRRPLGRPGGDRRRACRTLLGLPAARVGRAGRPGRGDADAGSGSPSAPTSRRPSTAGELARVLARQPAHRPPGGGALVVVVSEAPDDEFARRAATCRTARCVHELVLALAGYGVPVARRAARPRRPLVVLRLPRRLLRARAAARRCPRGVTRAGGRPRSPPASSWPTTARSSPRGSPRRRSDRRAMADVVRAGGRGVRRPRSLEVGRDAVGGGVVDGRPAAVARCRPGRDRRPV